MDRQELITKLSKCQHNPIKDLKALEAFSDDGLKALEAHCTQQTEAFAALEERATTAEEALETSQTSLKAAEAKISGSETKIKTLEGDLRTARKPLSEEDWLKQAPESIRGLVERQQKLDAEKKADLVDVLKTAQEVYDEEELKAMGLPELERTAKLLKIDQPVQGDFSAARAVPRQRNASSKDDVYQNPPDPYEAGVKALQARYGKAVN